MLQRFWLWTTQLEWFTLMLIILIAGGFWGFIELAETATTHTNHHVDTTILLWFRSPEDLSDPIGPTWFEEAARDITALGSVTVLSLATLSAVGLMFIQGQHRAAVFLATAVVGGVLISFSLKELIDRPRPTLVPHGTRVYSQSFPSGHASMSAVAFLTIGALVTRSQTAKQQKLSSQSARRASHLRATRWYIMGIAVVLALLVGTSRVYLGVHWPSDVLAGWILGAAWAAICWLLFRRWQQTPAAIEELSE